MFLDRSAVRCILTACLMGICGAGSPAVGQEAGDPRATVPTLGAQPQAPEAEPTRPETPSVIPPTRPPAISPAEPAPPPVVETAVAVPDRSTMPTGDGMELALPEPSIDAVLLSEIRRQTRLMEARGALLQAQVKTRDLQKALGNAGATESGAPILIGIYGSGDAAMTAEFLVGKALRTARPGEWVNDQWRVERVLANGVKLRKRDGTSKTAFLGSASPAQPSAGSSTGAASRSLRRGAGPSFSDVPGQQQGMNYESDAIHTEG